MPEPVAIRCDLVLGDLDGAREQLYREPRTRLPSLTAVFPDGVPPEGGRSDHVQRRGVVCEDFFHVNDGRVEIEEILGADGAVAAYREAKAHDPLLELRLLLEYFDRNHDYRRGPPPAHFQPASIACDLGSAYGWLRYFRDESEAASWSKVSGDIGRKRSYSWSMLGDWTLRLRRPG